MSATLLPGKGSPPAPDAAELAVSPSVCDVIHDHGSGVVTFDRETVESLLASGSFFWLDVSQPTADDFDILREVFKFHPLALEDSEQFNQRAKIDGYDDFVFIVVYGAGPDDDRLVEVHCFYSERFLITVHRDDCPAFAEIRRRYRKRERAIDHPSLLLYRVVDGLVDSFFPSLAELDDRIDELEDAIFLKADENQLQEIFQMKRRLVGMRKTVTPQRDAFASLMGGVAELPGLAEEDEHYFRDVYDHLIRISDLIDSYRDLLTGAMDVYLSTVSNRTNAVMKQLTIIATIFLPLTFITGFFGQNFDWMVSHVHSWPMFLVLSLGACRPASIVTRSCSAATRADEADRLRKQRASISRLRRRRSGRRSSIKGSIPGARCRLCKWRLEKRCLFTGILQSPLTDSNRRPPPYHALLPATGCNPRQRFPRV
jgi:magnesium transporter